MDKFVPDTINIVKNKKEKFSFSLPISASLEEDSVDELTALKDAIAAYISANYPDDEDGAPTFTNETTIHYGQNDPIIEDLELSVEYEVPSEPIVIKSVKVTKY